jgi:hypothetical protein
MSTPHAPSALPVFDEIVLGADDVLVLVPRQPLSDREADLARRRIPLALQDRVLIAWGFDITVARNVTADPFGARGIRICNDADEHDADCDCGSRR